MFLFRRCFASWHLREKLKNCAGLDVGGGRKLLKQLVCRSDKVVDLHTGGSGFGGGVGRMREVCGAVSGMVLVLNMVYGSGDLKDKNAKDGQYARIQAVAEAFKAECGSIICRELLGLEKKESTSPQSEERTPEYYKKRPCVQMVEEGARIFAEYLESINQ